tara:strand:+ start:301 stop:1134 length:834 start_codon:yes stop_codon:yes gene_type:complete
MKILSIDVGIKNLAVCLLYISNNNYTIEKLEILNLIEDKKNVCEIQISNKKNELIICNKPAKFIKNNCFYCKNHATKNEEFILPTSDLNKIKRLNLDELNKIINDYDISFSKKSKVHLIDNIEEFKKNKVFENIGNIKCNEISLIEISKKIKIKLDIFLKDIDKIDIVLIENQISPIANRMNCIQGMITQYFINIGIYDIKYISAINKLKEFIGNEKLNYNERKKKSIEITKKLLNENNMDLVKKEFITNLFLNSKKQDDLADCFLQAYWYFKNIYI